MKEDDVLKHPGLQYRQCTLVTPFWIQLIPSLLIITLKTQSFSLKIVQNMTHVL
jgi:hypothetical protein